MATLRNIISFLTLLTLLALSVACTQASQPAPVTQAPAPTKEAPSSAETKKEAPAKAAEPKAEAPAKAAEAKKEAPAKPKEMVKVKVGVQKNASDAGFFIAKDLGYFTEQGIDAELVVFAQGPEMIPALASGQLDVGGGAPSAGLYNAFAREIQMKIVADKGHLVPGRAYMYFMARKDLYDRGALKNFSDLKGKKVAINLTGSGTHYSLDMALQKGGITEKDIDLVTMPFADMVAAFQNKAVDAAIVIEPWITRSVQLGVAQAWVGIDQIKQTQVAVVLYASAFVTKQPDAARRFMVAYIKAVQAYNDGLFQNKGREQVVEVLMNQTGLRERPMYDSMFFPGLDPNGKIDVDSLDQQQKWFADRGLVKTATPLSQIVDEQYIKAAVDVLGKR